MKFWLAIKSFFYRLLHPGERLYKVKWVTEVPDALDTEQVYIVGENENVWSIAFICPCGCKDIIQLNALNSVRPRWRVDKTDPITISPSIWRIAGCKSHFYIRKSKVLWVNDKGGDFA